ncbi:MAG: ComEC/Rec2 family competence protein [Kyrpidia tusciae]|nr:ComEC/Rec2 family competence protein [Kyrpidia tusciae]MBE3552853.1 ComEC/Rec2 family competence protein [Kyrpidia tusciae]
MALLVAMLMWGWRMERLRRRTWVRPEGVGHWIRFYVYRRESVAVGLAVAACFAGGRVSGTEVPPLDGWIGEPVDVEARVVAVLPRIPGADPAVEAELVRLFPSRGSAESCNGVRVRMGMPVPVVEGDWIEARIRLSPPPAPRAPFPHGVADPWERAELFYRAELESPPIVRSTWRSVPGKVRSAFEQVWSGKVNSSSEPLLKAMVLGDTGDLDPALSEAFALTGVAHVVAVSGAHLHVVLWPLRRWLEGRTSARVRFCWLVGTAFCYAVLTGGSPSAMRAAAMVTYAGMGEVLGRRPDPLHAWGVTLAAESLLHPEWVFDLGFQLSYAATWGIFVLTPALRSAMGQRPRRVLELLAVAGAAEIATCPISFSRFYVWNGWTLLANLWVPLAGALLLGVGLLSLLTAPIPVLGDGLIWIADLLAQSIIGGVTAMDGDRRWLFRLGELPLWIWALYGGGVLWALSRWGKGRRTGRFCTVVFCAVVVLSARAVPEQMVVFALDGGSAIFLESQGVRELICRDDRGDLEMVIVPYLRRLGVYKLDRVWLATFEESGGTRSFGSGLEVLKRRLAPERVLPWDRNHSMRVEIGDHPIWVGGWPPQILLPGRFVVDVHPEEPLPGFTGLERRWSTKADSGLLIQSEGRGNVAIRGIRGTISTPSHGLNPAFPLDLPLSVRPRFNLNGL